MITENAKAWQFKPQERDAAKKAGETMYFTGRPCSKGHVAMRFTSSGSCHTCSLSYQIKFRLKNIDRLRIKEKEKYANNREQLVNASRAYRAINPEKVKETTKKWRVANRHKRAYTQQLRNTIKTKATPTWLTEQDKCLMLAYYKAAKEQKELYGVSVAVDHIVPLNGKNVCGLHVPWNLCLRTQSDNSRKSNKLGDDAYWPKQVGVLVCESALPWNLKEEQKNAYI